MKKYGLSAIIAAGLMAGAAATASAADLGGNCCADLEERITELEATTARKGNKKVSLTISGWVAEQILGWDDGVERNAYVTGLGATLSSHFKLAGSAKITSDISAGYVLHVEVNSSDPLSCSQSKDDCASGASGRGPNVVEVLESKWFLKSNHYGQITVGQQSHASDNAAILVDGSGSLAFANWVLFDNLSFNLRSAKALQTATWGSLAHCGHISAGIAGDCNGVPNNAVRYDSPTFYGFSVSTSWGEDDFWDVTGRWAGEHSGFKLAAVVSYSENKDETLLGGVIQRDSNYFQTAGYIQHIATGLFVYGAYGKENNSNIYTSAAATAAAPDGHNWYLKAGIRQKFLPLGASVLYGHYGERNDMFDPTLTAFGTLTKSNLTEWGIGAVQEIDAAAMSLFINYKNFSGDVTNNVGTKTSFDDFHVLKAGALISF